MGIYFNIVIGSEKQWWETFANGRAELALTNGKFTGSLVNILGAKVEVYQGKVLTVRKT